MKATFALALDIDDTLTTGNLHAIRYLLAEMQRKRVPVYLNTARQHLNGSCLQRDILSLFPDTSKHLCRRPSQWVEEGKVANMHVIRSREKVDQVILVDDLHSNVSAVESAGFRGIQVDAATGLEWKAVAKIIDAMRR